MSAVADPVEFCVLLRGAGLVVSLDRSATFVAALRALEPATPAEIYWAGRSTLLGRPEDQPLYDRVFGLYFLGTGDGQRPLVVERSVEVGFDDPGDDGGSDEGLVEESPDPDRRVRWSAVETLRQRDLGELTEEEAAELWRAVGRLRVGGASVASRRRTPGRDGGIDLRRSVRAALRREGELIDLRRSSPSVRPRPLVLLVDVSGSMEHYARALIRFAHAARLGRRRVEVFALGTRLTRITRELSTHDPSVAMADAADAVADWSGGTRLGAGIGVFLDEWGQRGMARGATVVVLSDGWDRGKPEEMVEQMARLRRLAHRIVWVNPLRASPGYAPLARGMAAALPYCDEFVDGHSMASLEELADLLARPLGARDNTSGPGVWPERRAS